MTVPVPPQQTVHHRTTVTPNYGQLYDEGMAVQKRLAAALERIADAFERSESPLRAARCRCTEPATAADESSAATSKIDPALVSALAEKAAHTVLGALFKPKDAR